MSIEIALVGRGQNRSLRPPSRRSQVQVPGQQGLRRVRVQGPHQRQGGGVGAQQDVLAVVDPQAKAGMVDPPRPAARRGGGLVDPDRAARPAQARGGGQARPAGADDGDGVHFAKRRTSPRPPPTQVFQASQNLRIGVSAMRRSSTRQPSRSISSSRAM
ncbi:hypothetical protein CDEN61S_02332 [Castellaniella denitrificans]